MDFLHAALVARVHLCACTGFKARFVCELLCPPRLLHEMLLVFVHLEEKVPARAEKKQKKNQCSGHDAKRMCHFQRPQEHNLDKDGICFGK